MPPEENVESTLIWYKGTDSENFKHWVDSLQDFLKGNRCNIKKNSLLNVGCQFSKKTYFSFILYLHTAAYLISDEFLQLISNFQIKKFERLYIAIPSVIFQII